MSNEIKWADEGLMCDQKNIRRVATFGDGKPCTSKAVITKGEGDAHYCLYHATDNSDFSIAKWFREREKEIGHL